MSGGSPGSRGERRGQDPLQTLGANIPAGQHHAHIKHQLPGHSVLAAAFSTKDSQVSLTVLLVLLMFVFCNATKGQDTSPS